MSDPITNLSQKFAALADLMAEQHAATLAALAALRGAGPDNSLAKITSAIFALAGPAPGITLADLHLLIAEGLYTQPQAPLNLRIPYLLGLKSNTGAMTLADLLQQIHIDIAGEEEAPPPIGQLNSDPGLCGNDEDWQYGSRVGGFHLVGQFDQGSTTYNAFAPNAPAFPFFGPVVNAWNVGSPDSLFVDQDGTRVNFCMTWDFTGMSPAPGFWRLQGNAGELTTWPDGVDVAMNRALQGQDGGLIDQGASYSYRFAVPADVNTLANNVWWHASITNINAS